MIRTAVKFAGIWAELYACGFHKNFIGIVSSHDYDLGAQSSFIRELLELVWWLDYNYYMVITIEFHPYLV